MVALSSYDSSISLVETVGDEPDLLGQHKAAMSMATVSAIRLLRAYMTDAEPRRLGMLSGVKLVLPGIAAGDNALK